VIDIVVAVHARSSQSLATMTVDELDQSWAVNVRSILLLAQGPSSDTITADLVGACCGSRVASIYNRCPMKCRTR
jgi:hypothetical protein